MYSPWTTSTPCLLSSNNNHINYAHHSQEQQCISSLSNLDLSNPFNFVACISPASSVSSLNSLHCYHNHLNEQRQRELNTNHYFEPLPFFNTQNQQKQINYPQLSQKHTIIKQMIARKTKHHHYQHDSYYNSCDNLLSSTSYRHKRQICSFCKSNGESANVYTSHILRNVDNEIVCPVLMAYICPKCGATGKSAHTIKYCTALSEGERVALPTVKLFKEGRSSSGNMNLFKK